MIYNSIVVLCLLGAAVGSPFRYSEQEYDRYRGPPAPLNPDGTVAFTPEYEHIRDEHKAAFEREYHRVRNSINAIDHYSSFPNSPKAHGNEDHGQYLPEIHEEDGYDSPAPVEDEGQYRPELYEKPYSSLYDDGQYRPHLYEEEQHRDHNQYIPHSEAQYTSYRPAFVPATLNPDGTVAHTPEYNAIASSFLNYHQALSRHRRSAELYQGPPAPLNHDFTVDHTHEVKQLQAAHFKAIANQFKRLHETAALAAAHPDRTSPTSKDYIPQNGGQHDLLTPHQNQGQYFARKKRSYIAHQPNTRHYDDGQYRPHSLKHDNGQYRPYSHYHYHGQYQPQIHHAADYNSAPYRPAPLNADGTVAHVPEYHAIAASHHQTLSHGSL